MSEAQATPPAPLASGKRALWILVLIPLLALLAVGLEEALLSGTENGAKLGGQFTDAVKKAVDADGELARWLLGLATGLIGATAAYLRVPAGVTPPRPRPLTYLSAGLTLAFGVFSVLCGHIWQAGLRNQLARDILNRELLLWPERLQYLFFLLALASFAVLLLERETAPRPPPPPSLQDQVLELLKQALQRPAA